MGREESQSEEGEKVEGLRQGKATGSYVRVSDACGLVMGVEVWEQRKASADFPGICLLLAPWMCPVLVTPTGRRSSQPWGTLEKEALLAPTSESHPIN